jgi:hypothetical protein
MGRSIMAINAAIDDWRGSRRGHSSPSMIAPTFVPAPIKGSKQKKERKETFSSQPMHAYVSGSDCAIVPEGQVWMPPCGNTAAIASSSRPFIAIPDPRLFCGGRVAPPRLMRMSSRYGIGVSTITVPEHGAVTVPSRVAVLL